MTEHDTPNHLLAYGRTVAYTKIAVFAEVLQDLLGRRDPRLRDRVGERVVREVGADVKETTLEQLVTAARLLARWEAAARRAWHAGVGAAWAEAWLCGDEFDAPETRRLLTEISHLSDEEFLARCPTVIVDEARAALAATTFPRCPRNLALAVRALDSSTGNRGYVANILAVYGVANDEERTA